MRGAQTPFTTFGFGRGISWAERQIQIAILNNRIRGLGKGGKTPVFPKLVFALESGVNLKQEDPNYDIKLLAIKCSTLRMYPDIVSVPKIIETTGSFKNPMGCRSFLGVYEENGTLIHDGRFNMGVVTINLPRVALETGNWNDFYKLLDEKLELCREALLYRIQRLKGTRANVAPILYMEGAVSRLKVDDTIDHLLENGRSSISLGYIGVHETILAMSQGQHIYDSEELQSRGHEIVQYLSKKAQEWKDETGYGFSLYSTPAESLCYRFCKLDTEKFGLIEGITVKGYYTNSFHLDVAKKATPFEKIKFEMEYPKHANGGFITYCEFDSLVKNPQALEAVWDFAYYNIPYFGTNTPVDKCYKCDFEGEFDATATGFTCPNCANNDPKTTSVIRRCCGYLSEGLARPFNAGKQKEVAKRVKHSSI